MLKSGAAAGMIWTHARFPASFERYVFGRSDAGDWALPKTPEILNKYGLKDVFFVEPLSRTSELSRSDEFFASPKKFSIKWRAL
jgi:hypothetical protein